MSSFIRRANISAGGSVPTPRLPDAFTELAYLESTGTQYIDTGIIPTADIELAVDLQLLEKAARYVFGRYVSNAQYFIYISTATGNGHSWQFGWSSKYYTTYNYIDTLRHVVRLYSDGTKSYLNVDGTNLVSTTTANHSGNTYTFLLFRGAEGNSVKTGLSQRVYSCRMVNRNTQADVLNLVPAMRNADSVVGMYDLVGGNFLTNAGTGSFGYGELQ